MGKPKSRISFQSPAQKDSFAILAALLVGKFDITELKYLEHGCESLIKDKDVPYRVTVQPMVAPVTIPVKQAVPQENIESIQKQLDVAEKSVAAIIGILSRKGLLKDTESEEPDDESLIEEELYKGVMNFMEHNGDVHTVERCLQIVNDHNTRRRRV